MKRLLSGFGFVLLAGCLPTAQPNQIIVDGEASLEFEPEIFSLTGAIRARSDTQAGALAEISDTLASIRDTMPNLEGLTHLTIDAASAALTPIQNPECMENRRYNDEEQCPIEGYFGSIGLSLEGSPANLSGQALSLLSELGAESVSLSGYSLVDRESAQKDALDAAVRDARGKADNIAQAAAATVIGPIRVQYGEGFSDAGYGGGLMAGYDQDVIEVTASRGPVRAQTDLDLDPQPIRINAKIVAAFEIE